MICTPKKIVQLQFVEWCKWVHIHQSWKFPLSACTHACAHTCTHTHHTFMLSVAQVVLLCYKLSIIKFMVCCIRFERWLPQINLLGWKSGTIFITIFVRGGIIIKLGCMSRHWGICYRLKGDWDSWGLISLYMLYFIFVLKSDQVEFKL